jgi:hypothetical protein
MYGSLLFVCREGTRKNDNTNTQFTVLIPKYVQRIIPSQKQKGKAKAEHNLLNVDILECSPYEKKHFPCQKTNMTRFFTNNKTP